MLTPLLLGALVIFAMRVLDVSLGTLRIVMLVRGRRLIAGVLSFLECLVWLLAAGQVLTNLDDPVKLIAFASGYAAGTMLGSTIERWIAMGDQLLRIVMPHDSPAVAPVLREHGFTATVVNAEGRDGDVRIVFSVVPRKRARDVLELVIRHNPQAFVTCEEVLTAVQPQSLLPRAGAALAERFRSDPHEACTLPGPQAFTAPPAEPRPAE